MPRTSADVNREPGGTDDTLETLGPYVGVWGHPAAFGGDGGWVYVLESSGGGNLMALSYGVNGSGVPQLTAAATSTDTFGYGSGSPIVTSNGTKTNTAVVWGVYEDGNGGKNGQLRAYRAIPSSGSIQLLWSGSIGTASKFTTPTSYDGMIYLGNRHGESHGVRSQVERAHVGLARRLRAGSGRVDQDHVHNGHGQPLVDLHRRI